MSDTRARLSWAALRAKDGRGHRQVIALAAIGVLGVLALLAAFFVGRATVQEQRDQIGSLSSESQRLYGDATALEGQVRGLGAEPVVQPAPVVVRGIDGVDGLPGRDGRDGKDGRDGVSPPCLSTPEQCQGLDGKDGVDGADGKDGKDGTDGRPGRDGAPGKPPARFTVTTDDGTYTCTRNPDSPDDAATYSCTG